MCTPPAPFRGRKVEHFLPREPDGSTPPASHTQAPSPNLSPHPLTPDPCPFPRTEPSRPLDSYTRRPGNPDRALGSAHHSTARRRHCQSPEPGAAADPTAADTPAAATTAAAPALASTAYCPLHPTGPAPLPLRRGPLGAWAAMLKSYWLTLTSFPSSHPLLMRGLSARLLRRGSSTSSLSFPPHPALLFLPHPHGVSGLSIGRTSEVLCF